MSALVVLALTGFSSGRGQGDSGAGGGCSSSGQDHDGSTPGGDASHGSAPHGGSSDDTSGDAHGSGTSAGGSGASSQPAPTASPSRGAIGPLKDGTAVLVHCATVEDPYATVEIRNPNGRDGVFTVKVTFKDAYGHTLIDTGDQVPVPAKDRTTFRVPVAGTGRVDMIDHCEVDPGAAAVR
ncbi:hypothetical protein [Streptomyces sp. NPDC046870]|uniref:hypothetical protein n=1 Tax=Streptomyces sp. NPDC046870 TaxID=3155135 RepID=UPI0034533660